MTSGSGAWATEQRAGPAVRTGYAGGLQASLGRTTGIMVPSVCVVADGVRRRHRATGLRTIAELPAPDLSIAIRCTGGGGGGGCSVVVAMAPASVHGRAMRRGTAAMDRGAAGGYTATIAVMEMPHSGHARAALSLSRSRSRAYSMTRSARFKTAGRAISDRWSRRRVSGERMRRALQNEWPLRACKRIHIMQTFSSPSQWVLLSVITHRRCL